MRLRGQRVYVDNLDPLAVAGVHAAAARLQPQRGHRLHPRGTAPLWCLVG